MPNIPLIKQTLKFIQNNPEIWDQANYCFYNVGREHITACFAGLSLHLHYNKPLAELSNYIYDERDSVFGFEARNVLDINDFQSDRIFYYYTHVFEELVDRIEETLNIDLHEFKS